MGDKQTEAWSSVGPECPNCQTVLEPEDPIFYDENIWDHECDCGVTFTVECSHSTSWETIVKELENTNELAQKHI